MKHIIHEKKLCLLIHGQERKDLEKTWSFIVEDRTVVTRFHCTENAEML